MSGETLEFRSDEDERAIFGRFWPVDSARGIVQILHGLAEHSARYDRFASALNAAGFAVFAHDHRGHGRSLGDTQTVGDVGDAAWRGLVADAAQAAALVRKKAGGALNVVFGHSMGSFVAQHLIAERGDLFDGVILSGTTDIGAVAAMALQSGKMPSFADYNAAFEPARTAFDWLSRDEAEVDAYIDDPLCGWDASPDFGAAMLQGVAAYDDPAAYAAPKTLPIYFISGDKDPLNAGLMLLNSLVEKYRAAAFSAVETKTYEDARHELLNETNRDDVTTDIIAWLDKRVAE